ncbi:hypothetical protein AURDEDRAFT_54632 [Auricularia subglabra TFB-10046 SS5]|nr:hypothetical protein AURDEDRAFT_54632 [Auricularia subglabra TFB-10046 SS5]
MSSDATTTAPKDWRYIAEGGATTVFAYAGPRPSAFDGSVLRLKKGPPSPLSPPLHGELSLDLADIEPTDEEDDFAIAFQQRVTSRLVPATLLPELGTTRVQKEWLSRLAIATDPSRPADRLDKAVIDIEQSHAVLATNLVAGKGIVPKWGFLPSPTHLSAETREIKTNYCRFCIHAHYKKVQGQIVAEGFCPLDLYSGDSERVSRAMSSLWQTWITAEDDNIHNMRVFLDGKTADPRDTMSRVRAWLLSRDASATEAENAFKAAVTSRLVKSSVLPVLAHLQRTLDPLDVEGLAALASQSEGQMAPREVTLPEWSTFLDEHQGAARAYDHARPDVGHLQYYRLAYILSASFKDCSIIINLGEASDHPVTLIDLDPKSPSKLGQWEKLDRTIVKAFQGVEHARCVDALAPRSSE